jgi:hypothetical protein
MEQTRRSNRLNLPEFLGKIAALPFEAEQPADFWPRYLACVRDINDADQAVLLAGKAGSESAWRKLAAHPAQLPPSYERTLFSTNLVALADTAAKEAAVCQFLDQPGGWAVGARLDIGNPGEHCVVLMHLPKADETEAKDALVRLHLAFSIPQLFQAQQNLAQNRADLERTGAALDTVLQLNGQKRFVAAALTVCNTLATRHACDRVSLGWNDGQRIRLRAISRTEKFDRQMSAARALETVMEETFEQNDEVVWPAPEDSTLVTRDHEAYARDQKVAHLCSVPLRLESEVVAVITCEREERAFQPVELKELRLAADAVVRRLADLQQTDRWLGVRARDAVKERTAKLLGPERTWLKLLAIALTVLVAVLIFVPFSYRVEGNFTLRSEEVAFLTAPFDGYIERVEVRPGDTVEQGKPLLAFKTSELELEESAALADLTRYQREAEKARAANALAEMRIAQALAEQSQARLDLVRYRLDQAVLKAPFAGAVVEGDLRERLGAPVKKADALFKVARIDTLYVEAAIPERDVQDVLKASTGEMAFVSQPRRKFPLRVVRVEQAALPREEGNVFLVRCDVEGGAQPWWRPGMSGVCKLDAGKRSLLWILTHRTVDFLRMKLWW